MGKCKLECPDGETQCCICCDKQGGCDNRCDMMDSYEYAEDCEDYVKEGGAMITFLLGFTLGTIFGVVGIVCVAIMYDKHHPDD